MSLASSIILPSLLSPQVYLDIGIAPTALKPSAERTLGSKSSIPLEAAAPAGRIVIGARLFWGGRGHATYFIGVHRRMLLSVKTCVFLFHHAGLYGKQVPTTVANFLELVGLACTLGLNPGLKALDGYSTAPPYRLLCPPVCQKPGALSHTDSPPPP